MSLNKLLFTCLTSFAVSSLLLAQTGQQEPVSLSSYMVAQPIADRTVTFNVKDNGVYLPINWGLDTAWPSEDNIRRGVAFMGADNIDVVRVSFQPTHALVDGELHSEQIKWINTRISLVNLTNPTAKLVINSDHPSVDSWYSGNAQHWAQLMDLTTSRFQQSGRTVITISPFNEPDYGWGQGSIADFYAIAGELRKNSRFDNIRISGGNTLNTDQALNWYNQLKSRLDEGNTHQLAGSFDNYANFYKAVRTNGHHATNDELHNVMEAMVGVEYGMQTGIWWGTAEYARSEFVKASDGVRLGYAEHRPNWTAASVYRHPNGKVQAFVGSSERQAATTSYRFVSTDRNVFYDGYGPQREFTVEIPGGTGYQQGQTNAEKLVNVSWGEDIQPVINGSYVLVNRNSRKVMEVASGSAAAGANVRQANYTGVLSQQWEVVPVDSRIGGDYSYFTLKAKHSGMALDVLNWSLSNGGNLIVYNDAKGANQQWYLEYAEDGWFYIRSRHSAKCMEVAASSIIHGANIQQGDFDGDPNQQWRLLAVTVVPDFAPPAVPEGLTAESRSHSVLLNWDALSEADLNGYTVFRSLKSGEEYETLAVNVQTTSFVDNSVETGKTYYYVVRATDTSLNRSGRSLEVSAIASGENSLVVHLPFNNTINDTTLHLNHGAVYGNATYTDVSTGGRAVVLNGSSDFIQLSPTIANHSSITIAANVNFRGLNSAWQRIFDFGNDQQQHMFLTPRSSSGRLRFVIKNGGSEQALDAPALPYYQWSHVAVTLGDGGAALYVNGKRVAESTSITIRPDDFKPVFNYIGRSQFANDPLLNAWLDDFRIYNYALNDIDIGTLAGIISSTEAPQVQKLKLWPNPVTDILNIEFLPVSTSELSIQLIQLNGQLLMEQTKLETSSFSWNVAALKPGMYLLKIIKGEEVEIHRFIKI